MQKETVEHYSNADVRHVLETAADARKEADNANTKAREANRKLKRLRWELAYAGSALISYEASCGQGNGREQGFGIARELGYAGMRAVLEAAGLSLGKERE